MSCQKILPVQSEIADRVSTVLSAHTWARFTTVSAFWQVQNRLAEASDSSLERWAPQNPPDIWHYLQMGNLTAIVLVNAPKSISSYDHVGIYYRITFYK